MSEPRMERKQRKRQQQQQQQQQHTYRLYFPSKRARVKHHAATTVPPRPALRECPIKDIVISSYSGVCSFFVVAIVFMPVLEFRITPPIRTTLRYRIYRTGGLDPAMVHLERNLISISLKEQLLARPAVEDLEKLGIEPRGGIKVQTSALFSSKHMLRPPSVV